MELKVGMYVRFKDKKGATYIRKLTKLANEYPQKLYGMEIDVEANYSPYLGQKNILKASNNIIELIEEDDLIKCQFGEQILILQVGARYTTSHPENGFVKGVFTPDNEFWSLEVLVEEDILQSILTKEQFESMSYKVK